MVKDIILSIVIYGLLILTHELAHLFVALILKVKVYEVKIGDRFFGIKIKKFSISPIIFSGYVEVDRNQLRDKTIKEIILFFMAGVLINVIILIISLFFINTNIGLILIYSNLFMILSSIFPFLNTDMDLLIKIIKEKKKMELNKDNFKIINI